MNVMLHDKETCLTSLVFVYSVLHIWLLSTNHHPSILAKYGEMIKIVAIINLTSSEKVKFQLEL